MWKKRKNDQGVLTVEACIAFTIFMMVLLTILFLMRIVYVYALVQHAAAQTAKELSTYTYLYEVTGINDLKETVQSGAAAGTAGFNQDAEHIMGIYGSLMGADLSGAAAHAEELTSDPVKILKNMGSMLISNSVTAVNNQAFAAIARPMMAGYIAADSNGAGADEKLQALQVVGGLKGLDLSGSRFYETGREIDIVVCYTLDPLLPIDLMPEMNLMNRAYTTGWDGKSVFEN
ncbi:TadE/TadG family type IV pilus assembly protein [Bacilliculturomica massiliensis]|uniref:TadE/TadG family type IV pilus assembly protein n=1 Tax=Bacilliculturomica massiliensis TaxID=1917867 RepID=UPI00102F8001|nr:TadE family protein [Bacilliculturomica massiliensis]